MRRFGRVTTGLIAMLLLLIVVLSGCSLLEVEGEIKVSAGEGFPTDYLVGDEIPLDKLIVMYDGGALTPSQFKLIEKSSDDIVNPNELIYTEKTYAVEHDGKTSAAVITVKFYKPLIGAELIRATATAGEYLSGEAFDVDNWRVKAWYTQENSVTVPLTAAMLGDFDVTKMSAGTHSLTLKILNITKENAWTLSVEKRTQATPVLHVDYTDTTATASITPGAEYKLNEDGEWTDNNVFTGLTPNTEYVVYARMPETDTHYVSDSASKPFTTLKSERDNIEAEIFGVTHNSFKVRYVDDLTVTAGSLQSTRVDDYVLFFNAAPNTEYKLTYWLSSNDTYFESEKTQTTVRTKAIPAEFFVKNTTAEYNGSPRSVLYGLKLEGGNEVLVSSANFVVTYKQNGVVTTPVHAGVYDVTLEYIGTDYAVQDKNCTLTISPKPLTVTANGVSATYGDAEAALTYEVSGLIEGDVLTGALVRASGTAAGTYVIGQGTLANADYEITFVSANYIIGKKAATIAVENKTKVYGEANPAFTVVTDGVLDGDGLGDYSFECTADANSATGSYTINIIGYSNDNYDFTATDGNLTVTKRALTVTADNVTVVYGGAPSLTYKAQGLVNGDILSGSLSCEGVHVGVWDITAGTLAASDNYDTTFVKGSLTVTKKALTVAVKQKYQKDYGDDNPLFEYTISGFAYTDTEASLTGAVEISCAAQKYSAAGDYAVTVAGVSSDDYEITFTDNILTVNKLALTVTADAKTQQYGSDAVTLTYVAAGLVNGDTLSGQLTRVAGTDVAEYEILRGTLANQNYDITFVGAKYTITAAPLTVRVGNVSKTFGDDNPTDDYGYLAEGFKYDDTKAVLDETNLAYVTSVQKDTSVGVYEITVTGLAAANYDVTVVKGTFEVTAASIRISVDAAYLNTTYDGQAKSVTATAAEEGDFEYTYEYDGGSTLPVNAGEYSVKVIFAGDVNYQATSKFFTLKISPRAITVTAEGKRAEYGSEVPLTYTYGDVDLLGNTFSGTLTREEGYTVGDYDILRGTLQLQNHTITFVGATYTIRPRTATVTVNDAEKRYGDDNPAFSYRIIDLLPGDAVTGTPIYATDAAKYSAPDTYAVSLSGLTINDNYSIMYVDGTLTVEKRDITVRFGENTFVYDGTAKQINASLTGLVNGDTVDIAFDKSVVDAGSYTVTASVTSANYKLTGDVTGAVTVEQAEQVISVAKTEFVYNGAQQSIAAVLTAGDGVISYVGNSFKDVGDYVVTVNVSSTKNYKAKSEDVGVKVKKATAADARVSLDAIVVDYGDTLIDDLLSGSVKNSSGADISGTFAFTTQNLKPTVAQSGLFDVTFTPTDTNYEVIACKVNVTVRGISVTVTPTGAGKVVGQVDPTFGYTLSGLPAGEQLDVTLLRAPGEGVGEYAFTLGSATLENYSLSIAGDAKFHIYEQLAHFDYSDGFIYRLGTVNTVELKISLADGVALDDLIYEVSSVHGNALLNISGRTATVTGTGIARVKIKIDGCYGAIFDDYAFEVVAGGKNVTTIEGTQSGNVLLHSDVTVTTTGFTVPASAAVYGNGYTVDARNFTPTSNYASVVNLHGLLENITVLGRYADTGYNSDDTPENRYKTVQAVYMFSNAIMRNCYISGGRYAVRTGGVTDALIENSTIANAIYDIAIMATGGNEKLTLRNVDLVQKPTGNGGEGVGAGVVFTEDKYPKNFTLRFEGNIGFHCFISKNDVSTMAGDYQTVLNTLWGSAGDFKYSIGGTDYINAAIAHIKADADDFILQYSDDCNIKNRLTYMEKSVSVAGAGYTGRLYSFATNELSSGEVTELYASPNSKAGAYSALKPFTGGTYAAEKSVTVDVGARHSFDRTTAKFVKYGRELSYTTSIVQISTSVGGYEAAAAAYLLEMGVYEITYDVYDAFDETHFFYKTRVSVMDNSPAPIIVFTYGDGKGSGTEADPLKWQGKTVGSNPLDPDYDCYIDVYTGVQAYDGRGNVLPLTSLTITYSTAVWSNSSSGIYSYKSNKTSGNPAYTGASGIKFTYKVSDEYGKTTTAYRYVKVTSWSSMGGNPDNGTAPTAARVTSGYTLGQTNVGEVIMSGKGTLVICDGKNVFVQASEVPTVSNASETHEYDETHVKKTFNYQVETTIRITYTYTLSCYGQSVNKTEMIIEDYDFTVNLIGSTENKIKEKVDAKVAEIIEAKETELKSGIVSVRFDASGVPVAYLN